VALLLEAELKLMWVDLPSIDLLLLEPFISHLEAVLFTQLLSLVAAVEAVASVLARAVVAVVAEYYNKVLRLA
jgi:hypothetical protein